MTVRTIGGLIVRAVARKTIGAVVVGVAAHVKARGGHHYRITAKSDADGFVHVFVADKSTGESPKTPCGPDEDDD